MGISIQTGGQAGVLNNQGCSSNWLPASSTHLSRLVEPWWGSIIPSEKEPAVFD